MQLHRSRFFFRLERRTAFESRAIIFIPYHKQEGLGFSLSKYLPENHYSRKNLAYLLAIRNQSNIIYDTDDDNYPIRNWENPGDICKRVVYTKNKFVNIYKYFSNAIYLFALLYP